MFGVPARSRLLPMSLPFRYFGAAVVFQVVAWGFLFFSAEELPHFEGGLGPVFAALHLATLGVLAMAAIGATLQLLPVATRQPVRSIAAAKLVWWLLIAGTALFAGGSAAYAPRVMAPGAALAAAALVIYSWLLYRNLRAARGMKVVVAHGWAALACLALALGTGLALVARYKHGVALDHAAVRGAHLVLAAYGFMGLLAMGLSQLLVPMFALAPPPAARSAYGALGIAVIAIAFAVTGFTRTGAAIGFAAAMLHIALMERALRARLRSPLAPAFLLIRVSWACLLGSLVLAALGFPGGTLLFGLALVPGWLLSFLLAILQRIVPFLASVHSATQLASALTPRRTLAAHRVLHLAALGALLAGVLSGEAWLARAAAACGLAAAATYLAFFLQVLTRKRKLGLQSTHQPATA